MIETISISINVYVGIRFPTLAVESKMSHLLLFETFGLIPSDFRDENLKNLLRSSKLNPLDCSV